MLLQIGPLLRLGSKCYYGWDFYYAWVQMSLQMGPLLHLGPVIALVPSTTRFRLAAAPVGLNTCTGLNRTSRRQNNTRSIDSHLRYL